MKEEEGMAEAINEIFKEQEGSDDQFAILCLAAEAVDARRQNLDYELPVSMETLCNFAFQRNFDVIQRAIESLDFEKSTGEDLIHAFSTTAMAAMVDGFAIASQIAKVEGLDELKDLESNTDFPHFYSGDLQGDEE